MKLEWGMLANHAEVVNNLAYIHGGGIDTINTATLPATFIGAVILRFLLHRTELGRPHKIDIRFAMADGQDLFKVDATMITQAPIVSAPGGTMAPSYLALNLNGITLPSVGPYSVEVLADDVHVQSLPFTVKLIEAPPQ